MKIKIFESENPEALCKEVNEFEETHNVKATQYEPVYMVASQRIHFTCMVFYNPEVKVE